MIEYLVPIGMFWIAAALYLGGMKVEFEGGSGPREVLGLVVMFVLFMAAWWVLELVLSAALPDLLALVVATLVTVAALPIWSWLGFRVLGVKVSSGTFAR